MHFVCVHLPIVGQILSLLTIRLKISLFHLN